MQQLMWVIVSYGGVPDALRLVDTLRADSPSGVDLVLACNRPGDADEARSSFAQLIAAGGLRVVDYPDNPGYLPAVARVVDERPPPGHLVFSNADMIAGAGVTDAVLAGFRRWPDALALAPRIIGERGIDLNPHLLRPPSARRLGVLAAVHRYPPVADVMLLRRNRHGSTLPAAGTPGQRAWSGHGSCVALSHQFFERGGDLHYPFALFGEELWIGAEVERLGGEVRYEPEIELRHDEHAATGSGRRRGWVAGVKYEGLRYWARRARAEDWG